MITISTQSHKKWLPLPLKILTVLLLFVCFLQAGAQQNNPPGFDAGLERRRAIEKGIHGDEIDAYVKNKYDYYQYTVNGQKNKANTLTIPSPSFERKAGNPCIGDFENGFVSPWTGYTAVNSGITAFLLNTVSFTTGTVTGRHTIMSPGSDPIVSAVNRVHNGNYSLRLGNNTTQDSADRVARTVTVTNSCLSFWYALIFEDPSHDPDDQPFFMFRVLDNSGNVIHSYVREASTDSFFTAVGGGSTIIYRDWTQYSVNLSSYVGQTVTVEFTTGDCNLGAHYGYAYIDDVCFGSCPPPPCEDCDDLFHDAGSMSSRQIITRLSSTDSTCCFKFNYIFDPDIFACDPFGVKVFKDGDTSMVYSSYFSDSGLVYENRLLFPTMLNFCLDKSTFTSSLTVRIAFYNEAGELICDSVTQILKPCCGSCQDVINLPDLYTTYPVFVYKGSTHSACCYSFNLPFGIAQPFKCGVYGIRVYEEGNPGSPLSSYQGTTPLNGLGFDQSQLDFCIAKATFTSPKTFVIALYDSLGNLICDSIKRTIEPCYSQSGCNCDNMFANSEFADVPVIKRDTAKGSETTCCFTFNPFRDTGIIKCPYYGFRIYKDSMAQSSGFVYLDTLSPNPLGGPGASYSPNDSFTFCIGSYLLDSGMTVRIEYLDSTGKVICSKTQELFCEQSCCDKAIAGLVHLSVAGHDDECCFNIGGNIGTCFKTGKIELWEKTAAGWVLVNSLPNSGGGAYSFGIFCREKGDTNRFMILLKDSLWRTICHKELVSYCEDCCKDVMANKVYRGSHAERNYINCCWDIFVTVPQGNGCPYYWPMLYEINEVPAEQIGVPSAPWPTYLGMYCTESYLNPAIYLPPGGSVTITKHLRKILAIYDSLGNLLCTKLIEDSCTRTFTVKGPGGGFEGLTVSPNPFDNTFTMQMNLQEAMAIEAKVIDSKGEEVWKHNYGEQPAGTFSRDIDLKGLPAGLYTLLVNNGMASVQIVKQ